MRLSVLKYGVTRIITRGTTTSTSTDTLRLVQLVFRHGDRNPVLFYPNDPYKDESYWPEGPGMLTPIGHQQLVRLGRYFRKVYKDYLPEKYSEDLVYVRSTYKERTQESVKSLMKTLFVN